MNFGDMSAALKMRDTVERISIALINRMRPDTFSAEVYSYNILTGKAQVRTAGMTLADPTIEVNFARAMQPHTANPGDGTDTPRGTIIEVEGIPGNYWIKRVLDGEWRIDASMLDPMTTIPPAALTDGIAPATAPVFTLVPGVVDTVFIKVDFYLNPDPVEYRIYMSTVSGFVPGPTNLYVQNAAAVTTITALTAGTPYYFRLSVIELIDGEGPVSAEQTATPIKIDAAALTQGIIDSIDSAGAAAAAAQIDADAAAATAQALALAGTDLVLNGNGELKANTYFSSLNYDGADAPDGATGSFYSAASGATGIGDQSIPISPIKKYKMSVKIRQRVAGIASKTYVGFAPYDNYGLAIYSQNYMYQANTLTTLAAALNPGDTTITLASSANWSNAVGTATYLRSLLFWDYVDAGGKLWPENTYSRNNYANAYADGGITGNVITLSTPWAGPAKPVGTKLSNGTAGGTYIYMVSNVTPPIAWTEYHSSITGVAPNGAEASSLNGFPPGCSSAKLLFLVNRDVAGGAHGFAAISLSDTSAAAEDAATAQTTADSKGKVLIQSTVPIAADQLAQNLWIDTTGGANTPKTWSGTAWVARTDKAATDAAAAAVAAQNAANAASAAASTAQTTANGKNKITHSGANATGSGAVGDTWFKYLGGVVIGMWRYDGTAWVVQKIDGLTLANIDAATINTGFLNVAVLIQAGAIAANQIAVDSITAGQIAADAVTVNELLVNTALVQELVTMMMTSKTFRTAEIGQRVQIDGEGIRTFSALEVVTAALTAASGGLSLSGNLTVNGTGKITAGTSSTFTESDTGGIRLWSTGSVIISVMGVGASPSVVALNGTTDAYVGDEGNFSTIPPSLYRYKQDVDRTYVSNVTLPATPLALATDSAGYVYVSDSGSMLRKFTNILGVVSSWSVAAQANGVGVAANGDVYTAHFGTPMIRRWSSTGTLLSSWAVPAGIAGFTVDSSGNSYISDSPNKQIRKYGPTGALLATWSSGTGDPKVVAVDSAGNIYYFAYGTFEIHVLSPTGVQLAVFPAGGVFIDLKVGSNGGIFAISADGGLLYEFTPYNALAVTVKLDTVSGRLIASDVSVRGVLSTNIVDAVKIGGRAGNEIAIMRSDVDNLLDKTPVAWVVNTPGNTNASGYITLAVSPALRIMPASVVVSPNSSNYLGSVDFNNSTTSSLRIYFRVITTSGSPVLASGNPGMIRLVAFF